MVAREGIAMLTSIGGRSKATRGDGMYLKRIRASNFRVFGDGTASPVLDWDLSPGMNILVGENDAGKTAVVDAIRHVLWTTREGLINSQTRAR